MCRAETSTVLNLLAPDFAVLFEFLICVTVNVLVFVYLRCILVLTFVFISFTTVLVTWHLR